MISNKEYENYKIRIFLVRHGQPVQHSGKIFLGQADIPLSEQGRAEAEHAGERLIELNARPMRIYTSDLARARETAEIISGKLGGITVVPDLLFREMAMGSWDGELIEDIKVKFPEEYAKRGDDPRNYRTPGGENFYDLKARVTREFHRIFAEDFRGAESPDAGDLVIVAHLGVISILAEELSSAGDSGIAEHAFGGAGDSFWNGGFATGSATVIDAPDWLLG